MQMKKLQPSIWLGLIKPTSLDKLSKHCRCALFLKTKNERSMKLSAFFTPINFSNSFYQGYSQWFKLDEFSVISVPTQAFVKNRNILKMGMGGCGLQWDNSVIAYYLTTYISHSRKNRDGTDLDF